MALKKSSSSPLQSFSSLRSKNYEVDATFSHLTGNEKFIFNVRESPNSAEVTKIILDIEIGQVTIDRSRSSLENLGTSTPDSGHFQLLPGEDPQVRNFVDESILEVYVNDRFALTSRIYPSLETSVGASYDFGGFGETHVKFELFEGLRNAWPARKSDESLLEELRSVADFKNETETSEAMGSLRPRVIYA